MSEEIIEHSAVEVREDFVALKSLAYAICDELDVHYEIEHAAIIAALDPKSGEAPNYHVGYMAFTEHFEQSIRVLINEGVRVRYPLIFDTRETIDDFPDDWGVSIQMGVQGLEEVILNLWRTLRIARLMRDPDDDMRVSEEVLRVSLSQVPPQRLEGFIDDLLVSIGVISFGELAFPEIKLNLLMGKFRDQFMVQLLQDGCVVPLLEGFEEVQKRALSVRFSVMSVLSMNSLPSSSQSS